jgi:hypothetical protein
VNATPGETARLIFNLVSKCILIIPINQLSSTCRTTTALYIVNNSLAVGASAPLPQREICMRPRNAKALTFQPVHTAVVSGARSAVALGYRVGHRRNEAGEECCQDDGDTHDDNLQMSKMSVGNEDVEAWY